MREILRVRNYSYRTEQTYIERVKSYFTYAEKNSSCELDYERKQITESRTLNIEWENNRIQEDSSSKASVTLCEIGGATGPGVFLGRCPLPL